MSKKKVQIDFELFLLILSLLSQIESDVFKSDDDGLIMTYNNVANLCNEKLKALKSREYYQLYQEAKESGNKEEMYRCLKEYTRIRNS